MWSTLSLLSFLPLARCTRVLRAGQRRHRLRGGGRGRDQPRAAGPPGARVIGDGSAMYGIQALWTAAHLKLPITYLITNNSSYRILKERLKSMRGTDQFIGMDLRNPDYRHGRAGAVPGCEGEAHHRSQRSRAGTANGDGKRRAEPAGCGGLGRVRRDKLRSAAAESDDGTHADLPQISNTPDGRTERLREPMTRRWVR